MVGADVSLLSVEALRWAGRLAPVVGGPVVAVMAWEYTAAEAFGAYPGMEWDPEQDARACMEGALEAAYGSGRPGGLVARVVRGRASQALLELGRGARLLIVGSRGLGGFGGLLLGPVSAACAEHAACPVLVVHGEGDAGARPSPRSDASAGDHGGVRRLGRRSRERWRACSAGYRWACP